MDIKSPLVCKHCGHPRSWHNSNTGQCYKPQIQESVFEPLSHEFSKVDDKLDMRKYQITLDFEVPQGVDLCWDGINGVSQAFHDLMGYTLSGLLNIVTYCGEKDLCANNDQKSGMDDFYSTYHEMFKSMKIINIGEK